MPRLRADIRISLKKRRGPTRRIELVQEQVGRRCWVRWDGKYWTANQTAEHIRRWLVAGT